MRLRDVDHAAAAGMGWLASLRPVLCKVATERYLAAKLAMSGPKLELLEPKAYHFSSSLPLRQIIIKICIMVHCSLILHKYQPRCRSGVELPGRIRKCG